jgi:hypothetical protein
MVTMMIYNDLKEIHLTEDGRLARPAGRDARPPYSTD